MAKTHIIEAILSFPAFDQPRPAGENQPPKYGATFILTKEFQATPTFKALLDDCKEVAEEKFGKKGASYVTIGGKHSTFRNDGAEKGYPEGSLYIGARTQSPPGLVYPWPEKPGEKKPARVPPEKVREVFYPGCRVRASIKPFAYENSGNRGVGFALNNVQWIGHGDRLDGRRAAEEEFEADLSLTPESLDDAIGDLLS